MVRKMTKINDNNFYLLTVFEFDESERVIDDDIIKYLWFRLKKLHPDKVKDVFSGCGIRVGAGFQPIKSTRMDYIYSALMCCNMIERRQRCDNFDFQLTLTKSAKEFVLKNIYGYVKKHPEEDVFELIQLMKDIYDEEFDVITELYQSPFQPVFKED